MKTCERVPEGRSHGSIASGKEVQQQQIEALRQRLSVAINRSTVKHLREATGTFSVSSGN
jgi:hypothetical protein